MLRNIKDTGYPLRVQIWSLFTIKLWHLALVDFFMVATTGVSVPLQKACRRGGMNGGMTWAKG
ncbi:Sterol O-acyltransferase 2 (Sterol-ester synthase 2), partial [Sporothrix eucalyptigena]